MTKTDPGNFFEHFTLGQVIEHAAPRTVTSGDRALYTALFARTAPTEVTAWRAWP